MYEGARLGRRPVAAPTAEQFRGPADEGGVCSTPHRLCQRGVATGPGRARSCWPGHPPRRAGPGGVPRVERAKGPRRGVYRPKLTGRLTALTSAPAAPNAERAVTARRSGIGRRVPERRFDFTLRAAGVVARVHIFDVFFHTLDDFRNARPGRGSADPSRRHGRRGLKSVFRR